MRFRFCASFLKPACLRTPEKQHDIKVGDYCRLVYPTGIPVDQELNELLGPFICNEEIPTERIFEICSDGELALSDLKYEFYLNSQLTKSYSTDFDKHDSCVESCLRSAGDNRLPITMVARRLDGASNAVIDWLFSSPVLLNLYRFETIFFFCFPWNNIIICSSQGLI
jgi:hypothetical protein